MPMLEQVALTRALLEKNGHRLTDVADWRPLLRYTAGNPLTITVLVNQAIAQRLTSRAAIEQFVAQLRAGEATIADVDEGEGRTRSLAASLKYGFERYFGEDEQKVLALLHLFQGSVSMDGLGMMANPDMECALPVHNMTREEAAKLLDRTADAGLLTRLRKDCYSIHPALPWYFQQLFETYYSSDRERASCAYAEANGILANRWVKLLNEGNPDVMRLMQAEEDNLLSARQLALKHQWLPTLRRTTQGLRELYDYTGRHVERDVLVKEVLFLFVDPATDLPRVGVQDEDWSLMTEYRVRFALIDHDLTEAEHLQKIRTDFNRARLANALSSSNMIEPDLVPYLTRTLATSVYMFGAIQMGRGEATCVSSFEEASDLMRQSGDVTGEAGVAYNLAQAHVDIPSLRDLDKAQSWCLQGFKLIQDGDHISRGRFLNELGRIANERFEEARRSKAPREQLLQYLNEGVVYLSEALDILRSIGFKAELAVTYDLLGNNYRAVGKYDEACKFYAHVVEFQEQSGNTYYAAQTRLQIAITWVTAQHWQNALLYAQAALRGFQSASNAEDEIQLAQEMIKDIQQEMQGGNQQSSIRIGSMICRWWGRCPAHKPPPCAP